VSSLEPFKPGELEAFQKEQAARIRGFLTRLATRDKLLLRYINDRVAVLREEVETERLTSEDVALLLDSDYTRVYEVMSQGSQPLRWIIVWII
jgi:ABC-type dipeptide/oligopeptide/nickel transport system ATPase subunit